MKLHRLKKKNVYQHWLCRSEPPLTVSPHLPRVFSMDFRLASIFTVLGRVHYFCDVFLRGRWEVVGSSLGGVYSPGNLDQGLVEGGRDAPSCFFGNLDDLYARGTGLVEGSVHRCKSHEHGTVQERRSPRWVPDDHHAAQPMVTDRRRMSSLMQSARGGGSFRLVVLNGFLLA